MAAYQGDFAQLRFRVQGAVLRGMGEVDHAGLYRVLGTGVLLVRPEGGADLLRCDLALLPRQREHFVAGGLHRAGLVDVDMAGVGAEHALIGPQQGGDHRQVGLGAPGQKVDGTLRGGAGLPDQRGGPGTVGVGAVAWGLL